MPRQKINKTSDVKLSSFLISSTQISSTFSVLYWRKSHFACSSSTCPMAISTSFLSQIHPTKESICRSSNFYSSHFKLPRAWSTCQHIITSIEILQHVIASLVKIWSWRLVISVFRETSTRRTTTACSQKACYLFDGCLVKLFCMESLQLSRTCGLMELFCGRFIAMVRFKWFLMKFEF